MRYLFIIAVMMGLLVSGCSNSSKTITDHFRNLTEIAKSYGSDCDKMAKALELYLKQNEASLKSAVANVSQATPDEAAVVYEASENLHKATTHCNNPEFEAFKKHLSELVLREAIDE